VKLAYNIDLHAADSRNQTQFFESRGQILGEPEQVPVAEDRRISNRSALTVVQGFDRLGFCHVDHKSGARDRLIFNVWFQIYDLI